MAIDHIKSTYITNADASPSVANTAGEGANAKVFSVEGSAVTILNSSADATYQLVRIPSNCKVKSLLFESAAQTAGKFDVGVYYATNGEGGQPLSLLAANAISQALFASAIECATAVAITDITNESGSYTIDKRTLPIWQAAGLTADPGGFFDIVATVKTTAVTTGAARLGVRCTYTD